MTPDIFHDCRLGLLDVIEDIAGMATLMREGCEALESGSKLSDLNAQQCAADAADAALDTTKKLRAIALALEKYNA